MSGPLFAPPLAGIAQVALPIAVDALFDYAVPERLARRAEPGRRVVVPFGAKKQTGVIADVCDARGRACAAGAGARPLRAIERIVDARPVLSAELLEVLRECAAEILCPVGIALAAALPPGAPPAFVRTYCLTARGREALRTGALRGRAGELLAALARRPQRADALRRRDPDAPALLAALERDRLVETRERHRDPAARADLVRTAALAPGVDVEAAAAGVLARAPRQAALLRRLSAAGPTPTAALGRELPGVPGLLRALAARGLLVVEERPAARPDPGGARPASAVELTPEQSAALEPIADAVRAPRFERFLLHGVTGSGKTEVYLRAVALALSRERQALVLVPEITLTHQIVTRLRARFGDRVSVLHSGLRPRERLDQWQRIDRGVTPIVVGARSALFAPLRALGLIVIDEEHDGAYKSDEGFRYRAGDLAARRAARAPCPLVLGSATPSLETRFAADRGELRRLVLPRRVAGRPLPAVEIVDLERARAAAPGRRGIVSHPLRRAIAATLAARGQVLLLLNRRGFSTKVLCFDCGHAERCPDCDVALVYHATEQRLRCHYCGRAAPPPPACSGCGAPDAALLGVGTERLEEQVRTLFPDARIARLDRDTAMRRGTIERVLRGLARHELDIVLGTQILAKGHDFPGVQLVGVLAADLALHLPDFRAAERTFQLLTQVAGRAGRGAAPGRVLVQTFVPDHYAVRPVEAHDYERFYTEELRHRAALGYPPFGSLVSVIVSGPHAAAAEAEARRLAGAAVEPAETVGAAPGSGVEVLGPAPAPVARLRGRHRFQILIKGADAKAVRAAGARVAQAAARLPAGVRAAVDVDPGSML